MKLPPAEAALVERAKIVDYLLNPAHPDNGGKAVFFLSLGFTAADWEILANAFRKMAAEFPVAKSLESRHGRKYVLDGQMESPGGKRAGLRTIWIVDQGREIPRLVTAYPHYG